MAKTNYYLKGILNKNKLVALKQNSFSKYENEFLKQRSIICTVSYEGSRVILFTMKTCSLKYWDKNKQNVKYNLSGADISLRELNDWLNSKAKKNQKYIEDQLSSNSYIDRTFWERVQ